MGLTLPLVAVAGAAVKMSVDFNKAMANVATLIPGNTARVVELKASVQDMAIATGKSTDDLAGGLYQVISAFGDSADSVKLLDIAARASVAGLSTTSDAINLISAVTKGYGDTSVEAAEKAADLAFKTVELGQTTFPELAAAMGSVVPVAALLGVSQEELFAGFATLTGVTGNTAEVATQLRSVLTGMVKPTDDMTTAIRALGFAGAEAMVGELGMVGALNAVIGTTNGSAEAIGKLLGRKEAMSAAFALTGSQATVFAEKLEKLRNVSGSMSAAFTEQTQGVNKLGFTWTQFQQLVTVISQRLGDALAPALLEVLGAAMPLADMVVKLVTWFSGLSSPIQTTVIGFFALGAAIGPVVWTIGTLTRAFAMFGGATVLGALTPAFTSARIAAVGWGSSMLAIPYLGIAAGVTAIAAAFAFLIPKVVEGIRQFGFWQSLRAGFIGAAGTLPFVGPMISSSIQGGTSGRTQAATSDDPVSQMIASMEQQQAIQSEIQKRRPDLFPQAAGVDLSTPMMNKAAQQAAAKAKAEAEAWQKELDKLSGREAIQVGGEWLKKVEAIGGATKLSAQSQQQFNTALEDAIDAFIRLGQAPDPNVLAQWAGLQKANFIGPGIVSSISQATLENAALVGWARDQVAKTFPQTTMMGHTLMGLDGPELILPPMPNMVNEISPQTLRDNLEHIRETIRNTPNFWEKVFGGAKEFGAGLSGTIMSALTGGGNVVKSVGGFLGGNLFGGIADKLSGLLGDKGIGGALKGALGAFLPGIGNLLGSVLGGLVDKLFGPTEYEKRVRREAEERAEIRTGAEANMADLQMQAAMTGRTDLLDQFLAVQNSAAPEYLRELLADLNQQSENLNAAMQRYGITWEELGPKAKQAQIDMQAKQFIEDFQLLTLAGADVDLVIQKMSGSVSEFVQAAIRTGTEVPIAMQPMLTKMSEMGLLVDATGEQIELSSLSWSQTMTQGFLSVVEAINHLTRALGYDVPASAWAAAEGMNAAFGTVRTPEMPTYSPGSPAYDRYMGDGRGGTAVIEVDGRTIAEVSVPYIPGEVQRYGLA